ncbi:PAS domain-containing sensor histidine kinase [Spirulina sp. CS-785/01]|uniref:sensor histidine kinase n=1 Tax=Spirulina sp. CS-785/01 TaxID=3021716 RepID=UPI0023304696|nr:PAS domain-containing sensor histidine kinase [Spirulina sp. CS-785/01]MDB9313001.1 PAS domain-containing sensor histidine kinase [Spirulina sp. CS-785/01]
MVMQFSQIFIPNSLEYLVVNEQLTVVKKSAKIQQFTDDQENLKTGDNASLFFPELVGIDGIVQDIISGKREQFELKGVTRTLGNKKTIYFDLSFERIDPQHLLILFTDVTQEMELGQSLVQRANEVELLLSHLSKSENYIKQILTSMGDALLVTTPSGTIKTINQTTQQLFKYSEAELLEQFIGKIIQDQEFLFSLYSPNIDLSQYQQGFQNIELSCHTKNGESLIIEFSYSLIQIANSRQPVFVYLGRDITQKKAAEAEMNKALAKEKELNELKSRFISMTSHEFRNPLSSISMSVELLENFANQWTPEKRDKHLKRIKHCTEHMTNLLEDVLVIGRAEAGKLEFNPVKLDLSYFCRELVEEVQLIAGDKYHIKLQFLNELQPINLDDKLLRHILTNLLSNAIKYSPEQGEIDLKVSQEGELVQFTVQDHGIGIPVEDQERLFECFHRSKNVGEISGTGLGLSIVKRAVDLHQGEIKVSSEVGVGTCFEVLLPINNGMGNG